MNTHIEPNPSLGAAREEILELIERYFVALHEADARIMDQVLHPHAVYATADETPALVRDKQTYLEVLRQRESPQSRGEERRDQIDSIEFAGANTARAQVRCSIGDSDFVDYLTFVRDAGRWQVVAKIFQIAR